MPSPYISRASQPEPGDPSIRVTTGKSAAGERGRAADVTQTRKPVQGVLSGLAANTSPPRRNAAIGINKALPSVKDGLGAARAHSPLKDVTSLPFADDLPRMGVHKFLLDDRFFCEFSDSYGAIALPFQQPDEQTRASAQKLADVTGLHVFTPRVERPAQWEMLTPRPVRSLPGAEVEFDARTGTFHVEGKDGVRRQIVPEEHLGGMLGHGGYKTAFQLGGLTVVVYRDLKPLEIDDDEDPMPVDDPHEMIEKTRTLEALGAPYVAKIHGMTRIHGNDALVMDTYSTANRTVTSDTGLGGRSTRVYDVSLFTRRSVESLGATRAWMVERNVQIGDIQFLIGRDGTFYLADFAKVTPGSPPTAAALGEIDTYLALAHARLNRAPAAQPKVE